MLQKKNSVWAKQKELSYFSHCRQRNMFSLHSTVLQKCFPLDIEDTSFVKLPINKTVFTDLLMAAQRHRDTFTAPIPFNYHHDTESKSTLPRAASEAKAKTSEQKAAILTKPSNEKWVCLQSRKGLLISCNLVC